MQADFVHISLGNWEIHGVGVSPFPVVRRGLEKTHWNNLETVTVSQSAGSIGQQKLMASRQLHKLLRVTLKPFA